MSKTEKPKKQKTKNEFKWMVVDATDPEKASNVIYKKITKKGDWEFYGFVNLRYFFMVFRRVK